MISRTIRLESGDKDLHRAIRVWTTHWVSVNTIDDTLTFPVEIVREDSLLSLSIDRFMPMTIDGADESPNFTNRSIIKNLRMNHV